MQMVRKMVEQKGHRLVGLGCSDGVEVVEHDDPLHPRRVFDGSRDVVDERGQGGDGRGGRQRLEDCRVDIEFGSLQGGHEVGHEAGQVVVAVIEGEPPDPGVRLPLIEVAEPVTEQGGLAEAGRCGHQSQPMARIEGGVEPLGDPGSGDELWAPSRREQLGRENRSRHHPQMIGAQGRCDPLLRRTSRGPPRGMLR